MWFVLLIYAALSESVTSEVEKRVILTGGSGPCEGHVSVYYEKTWGYVGDKGWSKATEEVVCRSTHCGTDCPLMDHEDDRIPMGRKVWLNELKCNGKEDHLWSCSFPGWGISVYTKDSVKKIKCSDEIKLTLDEYKGTQICAGVVKYSNARNSGYFCAGSLETKDADNLCKSLKCGKAKELPTNEWMKSTNFKEAKKMKIDCSNIETVTNLWQCVTEESTCDRPVSVVCTDYKRLQISGDASNVCSGQLERYENDKWSPFGDTTNPDLWCHQTNCGNANDSLDINSTLTCSDKVNVVLMKGNNPSKCFGEVHVNVNGVISPVCASKWTENDAKVVCKELKCGIVADYKTTPSSVVGIMDNVDCLGSESSLWHCQAKHDRSHCESIAYVICGESIKVDLKDGPGQCAGRLEILYDGLWRPVSKTQWPEHNSDVICKQMGCGDKGKLSVEKFIKGQNVNLGDCPDEATTIAQCIESQQHGKASISPQEQELVGIICEKHKMVFLDGNTSCSGMVKIMYNSSTHWLSGSNETWNQELANTVCQQVHCGNATHVSTVIPTAEMTLSDNCALSHGSQFECDLTPETPDENVTIAYVVCTGSVTVSLTNNCWGHVIIEMEGKSGGVCGDAWNNKQSEIVCNTLNCGKPVPKYDTPERTGHVMVKSFYSTAEDSTSLAQYTFVMNDGDDGHDSICQRNQAFVVCSGSFKPKLSGNRHKCSGNVELLFQDKWLPVCLSALQDKDTQDTICQELNCGQADHNITYFGPTPKERYRISQMDCSGNGGKTIKNCNITLSESCTPAGLHCSGWKKMKVSQGCKGLVSVYSKTGTKAVSYEGWTNESGERLCQDLKCGSLQSTEYRNTSAAVWENIFSCGNNKAETIWDCENSTSKTKKRKQLFITCQDEPVVTLSGHCHGIVKINNTEVCSSHWNQQYSHLVCQEQNCSNAIATQIKSSPAKDTLYHHVLCDKNSYKLSQCQRVQEKCDNPPVSVYCVATVQFRTTKKCGGQIEVKYGDKWEKVCPVTLSETAKKQLCEMLRQCGPPSNDIGDNYPKEKEMGVSLECSHNHMDIKHCVTNMSCKDEKPAEIYCKGYVPTPKVPRSRPISTVSILLGVGLFLVLVILITIFVRIWIVKKTKRSKRMNMQSMNEEEFESGNYEDITDKENEMKDLSHGGFRSEAEVVTDARSTSSLPYDDIDEVGEAQPLTSPAATTGAQRENYIQDQSPAHDGVTYEVDDQQESYDDIEPSPKNMQTEAEVHNNPTNTTESNRVVPPLSRQKDGEYLEPDLDG
ncbi:antigen WC1.1 isoform X1 [Echeneis naucrates]|uniref:Antigen WC1.1-like n=1 Tax=Echeneis naucrates TaxID=173247 RepID=A0A665X787_ECHNA|nr:antigen WC1.1-like isoform X1 [Echeneis naucrates]